MSVWMTAAFNGMAAAGRPPSPNLSRPSRLLINVLNNGGQQPSMHGGLRQLAPREIQIQIDVNVRICKRARYRGANKCIREIPNIYAIAWMRNNKEGNEDERSSLRPSVLCIIVRTQGCSLDGMGKSFLAQLRRVESPKLADFRISFSNRRERNEMKSFLFLSSSPCESRNWLLLSLLARRWRDSHGCHAVFVCFTPSQCHHHLDWGQSVGWGGGNNTNAAASRPLECIINKSDDRIAYMRGPNRKRDFPQRACIVAVVHVLNECCLPIITEVEKTFFPSHLSHEDITSLGKCQATLSRMMFGKRIITPLECVKTKDIIHACLGWRLLRTVPA